jgi:hypothetical protein
MAGLQYLLELQRDWARVETYDRATKTTQKYGGAGIGITYAKAMLGGTPKPVQRHEVAGPQLRNLVIPGLGGIHSSSPPMKVVDAGQARA